MNGRVNVCVSSIIRSNGCFDSNYAIATQISAKVSVDLHELEQKSMLTTACWPVSPLLLRQQVSPFLGVRLLFQVLPTKPSNFSLLCIYRTSWSSRLTPKLLNGFQLQI